MGCSDSARRTAGPEVYEIELRPHETSILQPTLQEVREVLIALPEPRVTAVGDREFAFAEAGGAQVSVVVEGTPEGVERIHVRGPADRADAPNVQRFCAQVAAALRLGLYDPRRQRWLQPQSGGTRWRSWRRKLGLLRSALMVFAAVLVVVAVMAWHAGGRRQDGWLVAVGSGAGLYFVLRAWTFLERLKSGGRRGG